MQPEQAKSLLNLLLPQRKSEQAVTKRILYAVFEIKDDEKAATRS